MEIQGWGNEIEIQRMKRKPVFSSEQFPTLDPIEEELQKLKELRHGLKGTEEDQESLVVEDWPLRRSLAMTFSFPTQGRLHQGVRRQHNLHRQIFELPNWWFPNSPCFALEPKPRKGKSLFYDFWGYANRSRRSLFWTLFAKNVFEKKSGIKPLLLSP